MMPAPKNITLGNWYYLLVLFVLAISTYLAMPDMDNQAGMGTGLSTIALAGLAAIQLPLLAIIIGRRFKYTEDATQFIPRFILYYTIYFCWMTAITLLNDDAHNIFGLTIVSMTIVVFPIVLICSYYRARYSELDKWFYIAVIFLMLCIALQYKNLYSVANLIGDEGSHIGVSYFPLFVLPILLIPSSRIVRYASIALTTIIIISSIKRGGMIALGASLIVYILTKQFVKGRGKISLIITLLIIVLVMGGGLYYLSESTDNDIIERFESLSDDGGSDRDILWIDTYHNILNRDLGDRMVGNGYRSAQKVSILQLPAHNDVLEIWYDWGGIGLVLYGIAFISLCLYTWRMIRRKSRYAPHMAMAITIYFIISMISIVILYHWMVLVMFSIGILAGLADKELEEQQKQQSELIQDS